MVVANVPRGADHFRALIATLAGGVAGRFEAVRWEGDEGAEGASESDEEVTRKGRKRKRGEMDLDDERDYGVAAELDLCLGRGRRRVDTPAGRTAVLVLADVKAVQQVLRAADRLARPTTPKEKYPTWDGLEDGSSSRLVENEEDSMFSAPTRTNYQDPTALQALVDSWLQRFNESERAAAERARLARAEPDEDGFVTVSRSSGARVAPVSMRAAEEARRRLAEREQRKREGMPDFYRWQLRERRRKQAEDVRRRFEEDRKMVEVMREERERKRVKGS